MAIRDLAALREIVAHSAESLVQFAPDGLPVETALSWRFCHKSFLEC
jgi:hypothetical protein